jgi:hypothetical protein
MKRFFTAALLAGFVFTFWAGALVAQPDPLDSIILESKAAVAAGAYPGSGTDTSAFLYQKVYITNKDTITSLTVSLSFTTTSGSAYATLGVPRNFNGTIRRLASTLTGSSIFFGARYHSNSPDSALWAGVYDPLDPFTLEEPNLARKAFWEIKYDSVQNFLGDMEVDSVRTTQSVGFTNTVPVDIPVNFMKGIITVTTVGIRDVDKGQRPQNYSLSQNYPNPFNANTQISFALPQSGKTRLEIFNILGQRVNTLVDEYLQAGYKTVNWDGRDFSGREVPSGIYFYRLRSQDFLQTKKMLMIQ